MNFARELESKRQNFDRTLQLHRSKRLWFRTHRCLALLSLGRLEQPSRCPSSASLKLLVRPSASLASPRTLQAQLSASSGRHFPSSWAASSGRQFRPLWVLRLVPSGPSPPSSVRPSASSRTAP